jgi:hypothetical protein
LRYEFIRTDGNESSMNINDFRLLNDNNFLFKGIELNDNCEDLSAVGVKVESIDQA